MSLDTSALYNSKSPQGDLAMTSNPEQSRSAASKSPHSSQNFPFASKFANPMYQYQGFPTPGYFPGLYPAPEFRYLSKTPPLASQMAPLPPFPLTRPLTPPAAIKDKFAFEPETPPKEVLPPAAPKTDEEIIEEEMAEDEFQKNFVDALRKSGRLETAEKVIKARQQQLEERGRMPLARENSRPGQSPGASSNPSVDGDSKKDDVPDWFAKAQQEVEREKDEARKKSEHFERQMARFGLSKPKETTKPLELPPPYDKLDLEKKEESETAVKKEQDPYSNSTDEETDKKEEKPPEEKKEGQMSALDDVLNDVIEQSRQMTESKEQEKDVDVSRDSRDNLDSSRDEESRDYDDMSMAIVEDAPETPDVRTEIPSYPPPGFPMRPPYYSALYQSDDPQLATNPQRDYPYQRDPQHYKEQSETEEQKSEPKEEIPKPSHNLDLFRAMGLKSETEMDEFHKMMAMKARQMMMQDAQKEHERPDVHPFGMHLPLHLSSSSSFTGNFPTGLPSHPSGSLATTLTSGLPPSFTSKLMEGPRGPDESAPMFPGMGHEMMPFMIPDHKDGKEIFFCHLCSYTGTSKFHFNAHMNSHFEHRCPHCDYTSRTEGRLKRHIKDFHIDSNGQPNVQKTMRNNTPGRPKVYRCKQCEFVANTKVEFWVHARIHIKEEKVLQCPKCPFVTEYKHHLEYHLRNHFGSKPYKCNKCNYSCVNKSMLNSHMKSHTNVYQYRCADCTYATKYCHSLKLHLRKYNHKPATILNSDGSLPLEDTKAQTELMKNRDRGPRTMPRPQVFKRLDMDGPMHAPENGIPRLPGMNGALVPPMYWPVLNNGLHPQLPPPLMPVTNMVPMPDQLDRGLGRMPIEPVNNQSLKCKLCCFDAENKEDLNKHMLKVHAAENQDLFNAFGITSDSLEDEGRHNGNGDESHARGSPSGKDALDLTKPMDLTKSPEINYMHYNRKRRLLEHCLTPEEPTPKTPEEAKAENEAAPARKRSRKGKAFKLDTNTIRMQEECVSPAVENEEYDRNDEFSYTSEEAKDEDSQKVPDFNEVHNNLRSLNQTYHDERFVYSGEAMTSPFQRLNALTNSIDQYKEQSVEVKPEDPDNYKSESPAKPTSPYKTDSPYKSESPYKVDSPRQQNSSDNEDSSSGRDASSPEAMMSLPNGHNINIKGDFFECQYCEIAFRDCVLYTMHMGYHGYKDAFHCNSCGYQGKDKVDFFLHIARIAHV